MVEKRIAKVILYEYQVPGKGFGGTVSYPGASEAGYLGRDVEQVIAAVGRRVKGRVDGIWLSTGIQQGDLGQLAPKRIDSRTMSLVRRGLDGFIPVEDREQTDEGKDL